MISQKGEKRMSSFAGYVVKRVLWIPVIMFLVTVIVFALGMYGPGDPLVVRTQGKADPETLERVRQELGLDRPFFVQYFDYVAGFVQGDMGESISQYPGVPVWELLKERIWVTAQLNLVAYAVLFPLGIFFGAQMARNVGTWKDPAIISFLLIFPAIPTVILIPILLWIFVVKLSLLPAAGWHGVFSLHIIIPLLAMTLPSLASGARLTRISLLQTMGQDWVRTARAKGLPEHSVFLWHIFRPSLLPLGTQFSFAIAGVFSGSLFVELLYGIPGMGRLALESVQAKDYDIVMAVFIIGALLFLIMQIVVDIMYTIIDPRIRLDEK